MIEIFGNNGQLKCRVEPGSSSRQDKSLQGDNVLSLSFTHYAFLNLDVNDWCDFEGERYWLQEKYLPRQKNTKEWEYDLKLYGIESLIKRFLVLNNTDGENEAVFTLTAPASEHVRLIVRAMNDGMGNITDWKVGNVISSDNLTIDYEGTYCDEALHMVAEAAGTEWWIEGETVNMCRCEYGEEVTLRYGESLLSLSRDEADGVKFYTRLFPIGSSRNIDREKYGSTRLQLPGGAKYVDMPELVAKYGVFHHFEQEAFNGIYPRRVGVVSHVRHEEVTGTDGKPFTIWYFRDESLPFDPNDYEIANLVKHVTFQSGELAGRDFEVNYNSQAREFEIITTWPYDDDTQLPGGQLVPKGPQGNVSGDKYILWNIAMPDEYYGLAERELEDAVNAFNQQHSVDASVYKAPTNPKWVERSSEQFYIGRRVRLESPKYFPGIGYRSSRITRVSRKVSDPCQMDLEISDVLSTGAMDKLEDSIHDVKAYVREASGALPDIIRSWDTTRPTDNNLYSARRSHREFLSKNNADRANARIIFADGLDLGDYEAGEQGGRIDGSGNAELLTLVVRHLLRSARFADGIGGEGWQLWIDQNALANLTIDRLTVRQVMTVFEMLVEKIRSAGGQIVVSAANGKIKTVEDTGDYYTITFEQENTFQVHDLLRCQTFTGGHLKGYWAEVAAVDGNSILIAKSEFDGSIPEAADECVLMGNTTNTQRQNFILISATEDGQPRIDVMDGVHTKNFTDCIRARLGNLDGIGDDHFPIENQPHGNGLYSDNAYLRGTFLLSTGEDIKTKFEITEGKIESTASALRQDFAAERGYLNNPSFDEGLSKWMTENETVFWLVGNRWIWANNKALSKKGDGASVTKDDGRVVVRIKNKYICQRNANLRSIPTFEANGQEPKEAKPVYLSFLYRCASAGTLHVRFENVDKSGFENFNSFDVEETLAVTTGYKQYNCNGLWNGTGDFKLSFTGDIYLYMLILSEDKIESLTYKYRTLFEQSEKLVRIAAQNFDSNGNLLLESGMTVTANGTGIYARGADGKLAFLGVGVQESYTDGDGQTQTRTVIKLTADNIQLEGLVTANQKFKILADGSIEAVNGKFDGQVNATSGKFGNMQIVNDTFEGENGKLRFGSYATSYTVISTSQTELNRNANVYLLNDTGHCLYATAAYPNANYAIVALGKNAIHSQGRTWMDGGLVNKVRRVTSDTTLATSDNVVFCNGSSAITLTLPTGCEDGQQIKILNNTENNVVVQAGSGNILSHSRLLANPSAMQYYLATGNITLPATIGTSESMDGAAELLSLYTKAFGLILIFDSTASTWHARFLI